MFSPMLPIANKSVLHILKLVCWAQTENTGIGIKWL